MIVTRRLFDRFTGIWMVIALVTILSMPLLIGVGLFIKSYPILASHSLKELLFSSAWFPTEGRFGFWAFIASSIQVTIYSFLLAAPVSLLAAVYLTQYASGRLVKAFLPVVDILAGLPSVIYGVWGILIIVPFVSRVLGPLFGTNTSGYSVLAGGIVLAVMCIPYMLNVIVEVFKTVPLGLKESSLALGATYWETVKLAVIRKNWPGIISAFGLGIAKAFGETIAVLMVVGNRVQIRVNPLEAGYPLPSLIANNYGEMLSIPMYDSALMFAALLLFIIVLAINLLFRYLINRTTHR